MAPPKRQQHMYHASMPTALSPCPTIACSTVWVLALPLTYKSMAKCPPNTTTSSSTDKGISSSISQKNSSWSSSTSAEETGVPCGTSCTSVAGKGHFIVYTTDGVRFEVPLAFLSTTVFGELLRMSQDEFGFTGVDSGRITLPYDASVMEYAMCLLRRSASADMEAAFLNTMAMPCHYHVVAHLGVSQHFGVCSS